MFDPKTGRFMKGNIPHNKGIPRQTHCIRGHELKGDNLYWNTKFSYYKCRKCQAILRENNRDKIREIALKCYHKNKHITKTLREIQGLHYISKLKKEVLEYYGNGKLSCLCCGESIYEFLTIDHINNDGNEQRKIVRRTGHNIYRYLKKNNYPIGYQTLCFNCNSGKQINKGICPHKTLQTIPVIINGIKIRPLARQAKEGEGPFLN
jgi:hypothetical protein